MEWLAILLTVVLVANYPPLILVPVVWGAWVAFAYWYRNR